MSLLRSELTARLNRCNQLPTSASCTQSQNVKLSRDLPSPHPYHHHHHHHHPPLPNPHQQPSRHHHFRYCSSQLKFSHTPARLVVHDEPTEEDKKELQRKINLTHLVDALKAHVPDILETSLPKSIIARDIYLRICPSQVDETYVPKLSGQVTYYATCKAIQLFLTSVILSPKVKLHVQSVRVVEGSGAAGGGGGGGGGGGPTGVDPQCMFEGTTKVYVRWSTCVHGCEHLEEHGTSEAHLGSHKWSEEDTKKIFDNQKGKSVSSIVSRLPGMIMGLTKESKKLERVLSGLFIFELDEDNSKVLVHTIENMEIIERFEPKEEEDVNALRVC